MRSTVHDQNGTRPGAIWKVLPAAALLVLAVVAGAHSPDASAARGVQNGTCIDPHFPCSASEGQNYNGFAVPDGAQDTEESLESMLFFIEGEEVDVSPLAYGLTGDEGDFKVEIVRDESRRANQFYLYWKYSGDLALSYATVWNDDGAFAIYDIAKKTEGVIDYEDELGGPDNFTHISFWQRAVNDCVPVKVEDSHGGGMVPGCQLSKIVNGKVPCVNITTEQEANCDFDTSTPREQSGSWLEGTRRGVDADYAMGNQPITRDGEEGGNWIVASKATKDASLPCRRIPPDNSRRAATLARNAEEKYRKSPFRDTSSYASDGTLPGAGYTEVNTSSTNVNGVPLDNYATRVVVTSTPPPHPDGAQLVSQPTATTFGYAYKGAGLNDINGMERYSPSGGRLYIDDPYHRHFINYTNSTVAAAKRPATKPNGELLPNTAIAWRTVNPNANIAN